ncbi:hypothetical protein HMPREF3196_00356 [Bifidobacterium bifidum]|uniref:Uncharacterized protein n=1 Tax=Bifidobacterium bifidum TaxID=1681 RepID=A0A133KRY6_BIFBI|nr:hypothetical protein HMPREF3196_00356 [Bifidobacterium bifidum]
MDPGERFVLAVVLSAFVRPSLAELHRPLGSEQCRRCCYTIFA